MWRLPTLLGPGGGLFVVCALSVCVCACVFVCVVACVRARLLLRYHTSRKPAAHDDSIWAVTWPTEDKLITGSIDETVKVEIVRAHLVFSSAARARARIHLPGASACAGLEAIG